MFSEKWRLKCSLKLFFCMKNNVANDCMTFTDSFNF